MGMGLKVINSDNAFAAALNKEKMSLNMATTDAKEIAGYSYDTHVPLIFFGKNIVQGESEIRTKITDIAPTVVKLMGLKDMNDSTGDVLTFVIQN